MSIKDPFRRDSDGAASDYRPPWADEMMRKARKAREARDADWIARCKPDKATAKRLSKRASAIIRRARWRRFKLRARWAIVPTLVLLVLVLFAYCEPEGSYAWRQSAECVEMCGAKRVKTFQASEYGDPTCECVP